MHVVEGPAEGRAKVAKVAGFRKVMQGLGKDGTKYVHSCHGRWTREMGVLEHRQVLGINGGGRGQFPLPLEKNLV